MDNPSRFNRPQLTLLPIVVAAMLGLTACAGAQPQAVPPAQATEAMAKPTEAMAKPTEAMAKPTEAMAKPTAEAMAKPTAEAMAKPTEAMAKPTEAIAKPPWQTTKLTDARTGKVFTLADFPGKTVYIGNMATWCVNCAQQLRNVKEAQARLDPNKVIFIGLSVESNLKPSDLASYADKAGLSFPFAVLNAEQLKLMVDAFGFTAINPPSTPHFVIRPDGTVSKLLTGYEDANALVKSLGGQ